ncbi:D-cysteine desulfhydrase family protein [Alisedimentitalea sp. MJ-SS2]|uniref:D-cysteine desulfhydrase family protein n=1 Tax=Aliisedimentitalea sp. MJ-SS2 TaxID=3049795 RepID=UPI00290DEA2A|nr:D-cysteine desulfhydrase family protein [Alisedimentitalea sp. MJ-SS2]MDU8928766.1 D-cysteine desulfhydrase family protein [Alisedimentitalea sp. MJ-SS2]
MTLTQALANHPRAVIGHLPTPLERMGNLGHELGLDLWVKRDDMTGIGMGGNKVRQLEYYLGKAVAQGATQVLITGAVQSNFVRTCAAMAARLGMGCHIQLEERVPDPSPLYRDNGNVLLDRLLGATLYSYPEGEDEAGADANLRAIADDLKRRGEVPFIVPLAADQPPTGALGYAKAAQELVDQKEKFDMIFIASGSALTHIGLLFGLRALGDKTPVHGVCVRRDAQAQTARVAQRLDDLAILLDMPNPTTPDDILIHDRALAPGYGKLSDQTRTAITRTARAEGVFLDPVYTAKVMAGLILQAPDLQGKRVLFWHTGGTPALFAYGDKLGV